ncbi:MAG: Ig-like domain-containing protein [Candidatus Acidiferrales bacterium]
MMIPAHAKTNHGETSGPPALGFVGLLLLVLLPTSTHASPQGQPTLQITSPAAGTVVNPGQTLTVSATSPTPASFSQVFVGGDLTGFIGTISGLPGQLSFTIPSAGFALGTHRLSAQGTPTSGGAPALTQVSIDVERPDLPADIWTTLPGLQLDSPGEQTRLVLYADFPDNTTWRVTASTYVTFSSSNTAVATVDASGLVTAVAAGSGFITATYTLGGVSVQASIPVSVPVAPGTRGGSTSSFVVSATPGGESIMPGSSASFALSVNSYNGFTGPVALSASGLPNGITASFSAASVSVPGSSIVNFLIPSSTPLGNPGTDGTFSDI